MTQVVDIVVAATAVVIVVVVIHTYMHAHIHTHTHNTIYKWMSFDILYTSVCNTNLQLDEL